VRPPTCCAWQPGHLVFDGDKNYADAVQKVAKLIVAVSAQNYKPGPVGAPNSFKVHDTVYVHALPGDPAAIDFPPVFKALKAVGFNGFVTVMTDAVPGMDSRELSKRYYDFLKPLV